MKRIFALLILSAAVLTTSGCKLITFVQYEKVKRSAAYDAVIVPGFPYDENKEKMNFVHRLRVFWAYHLIQEGIAENVIFSGGAVHTPYVESEIMAQYSRNLGIPAEKIFVESRAEHSTENLFYGYALARELGFKRIAVATDPFQAQLIRRNTKQDDLEVDYIAAKVSMIMFKYRGIYPKLEDPCLAHIDNFMPLAERISEDERKLGTQGERFRKRYNLSNVTASGLEQIDFSKYD